MQNKIIAAQPYYEKSSPLERVLAYSTFGSMGVGGAIDYYLFPYYCLLLDTLPGFEVPQPAVGLLGGAFVGLLLGKLVSTAYYLGIDAGIENSSRAAPLESASNKAQSSNTEQAVHITEPHELVIGEMEEIKLEQGALVVIPEPVFIVVSLGDSFTGATKNLDGVALLIAVVDECIWGVLLEDLAFFDHKRMRPYLLFAHPEQLSTRQFEINLGEDASSVLIVFDPNKKWFGIKSLAGGEEVSVLVQRRGRKQELRAMLTGNIPLSRYGSGKQILFGRMDLRGELVEIDGRPVADVLQEIRQKMISNEELDVKDNAIIDALENLGLSIFSL